VSISVDAARCAGCLACAAVCRFDALQRLAGVWAVEADTDRCTYCHRCVDACPLGAIQVTGPPRTRKQIILGRMEASLRSTCPRGWSVGSGAPRFQLTSDSEVLVPDLAVVHTSEPRLQWLGRDEPRVALVVDLMPSTPRPEILQARREAYRRAGVPTYWTVDQRAGQVLVQWSSRPDWFDLWSRFHFA
jgi:ferredoxin